MLQRSSTYVISTKKGLPILMGGNSIRLIKSDAILTSIITLSALRGECSSSRDSRQNQRIDADSRLGRYILPRHKDNRRARQVSQ